MGLSTSSPLERLCTRVEEVLSSLFEVGVDAGVSIFVSGAEPLRPVSGLDTRRLVRRASRRLITLELVLVSGSSLAPRRSFGLGRDESIGTTSRDCV